VFRIVKDFVQAPSLLVMCDRPHCCGAASVALQTEPDDNVLAAFVGQARAGGWRFDLDQQVCPAHVKKESGDAPLVELARGVLKTQVN
jgi:hypothetical protein